MRVLSLFSGGGLGDFGLELAGMEIVGQVEIEEYCQKILALRWPEVPKWHDIRNLPGWEIEHASGPIDLISGGFPCQPFSTAGRRAGAKDDRNLWPEMLRLIREIKPRWVLAENVPGLLSIDDGRVFGGILRDLAESGYDAEWDCIPASAVGAPHRRDRVWIVAYPARQLLDGSRQGGAERRPEPPNGGTISDAKSHARHVPKKCERAHLYDTRRNGQNVGDTERGGRSRKSRRRPGAIFADGRPFREQSRWWATEPKVGRVAHGVANRVDRLKLLGNGQVVQVVRFIGERIMEADRGLHARVTR